MKLTSRDIPKYGDYESKGERIALPRSLPCGCCCSPRSAQSWPAWSWAPCACSRGWLVTSEKRENMTKRRANWERDELQFPRLIAELEAVGAFTPKIYTLLQESMDLDREHISELIDRAQARWDKIKNRT